jgi:predicted nucleic acid-binding Zn ribbon protein
MNQRRKPKETTHCVKCGSEIPSSRRSDAKYCSQSCRAAAEKIRYKANHPEYVERQKKLTTEWRHLKEHGHTRFIDNPLLNKKDRFALARSLGFRSMLEYNVAKQLIDSGVGFEYEKFKIKYVREDLDWGEDEQETGNEKW